MFFFRFSTRNSSTTVGTVTISLIVSMVDRYNVLSETRQYHGEHPSRAKCAILHRLEEGCGVRYWILIQYRTPLGTNVHNIAIPISRRRWWTVMLHDWVITFKRVSRHFMNLKLSWEIIRKHGNMSGKPSLITVYHAGDPNRVWIPTPIFSKNLVHGNHEICGKSLDLEMVDWSAQTASRPPKFESRVRMGMYEAQKIFGGCRITFEKPVSYTKVGSEC